MIDRLVFLPQAPILDPKVAQGAASELADLREVIDQILTEAVAATAEVVIFGSEPGIQIGNLLLARTSQTPAVSVSKLGDEPDPATTLIVMGDGSAKRSEKAPGYVDSRAHGFDDDVSDIFERAELKRFTSLDSKLGEELWVSGIEPWHAVGSWVAAKSSEWSLLDFQFSDPYGVGYFVASYARMR